MVGNENPSLPVGFTDVCWQQKYVRYGDPGLHFRVYGMGGGMLGLQAILPLPLQSLTLAGPLCYTTYPCPHSSPQPLSSLPYPQSTRATLLDSHSRSRPCPRPPFLCPCPSSPSTLHSSSQSPAWLLVRPLYLGLPSTALCARPAGRLLPTSGATLASGCQKKQLHGVFYLGLWSWDAQYSQPLWII